MTHFHFWKVRFHRFKTRMDLFCENAPLSVPIEHFSQQEWVKFVFCVDFRIFSPVRLRSLYLEPTGHVLLCLIVRRRRPIVTIPLRLESSNNDKATLNYFYTILSSKWWTIVCFDRACFDGCQRNILVVLHFSKARILVWWFWWLAKINIVGQKYLSDLLPNCVNHFVSR